MNNFVLVFMHEKARFIFILTLFLVMWCRGYASMRFLSVGDGLSNSSVHAFFQDKRNYMWVATDYGLNRVGGTDIKVFTQSFHDNKSLPNNYVTSIYEDSNGNFWIGTLSGLYKYNYRTEEFTSYFKEEYAFLSNSKIVSILEDHENFVWMVLSGQGLVRINPKDNTILLFEIPEIKEMDVTSLLLGDNGEIWMGSKRNGVVIFHPDTKILENVNTLYPVNRVLAENAIFSLCTDSRGNILVASLGGGIYSIDNKTRKVHIIEDLLPVPASRLAVCMIRDRKNRIWVGTDGAGLWTFDEEEKKLIPYDIQNFGFNPLIGKVQSLYEDKQGNIWAAFVEKGVVIIPAKEGGFRNIENNPYQELNITDQSVGALLMDKEQKLWMGTNGSGLFRLSHSKAQYKIEEHILPEENVITALFQDSRGDIYIGTYLHGFYRYSPATGKMKNYQYKGGLGGTINCNHITCFAEDGNGTIWISTNGGGINRMDPETENFNYFRRSGREADSYLVSDWCNCVYADSDNKLWIGTYAGLSCINLKNNEISSYTSKDGMINTNTVVAVFEDIRHTLWVGTNWGLNKIDKKSNKGKLYTTDDGLPDNVIIGFQNDLTGTMWVTTNNGIARYLPDEDRFVGYGAYDGINNQEFKLRASARSASGLLYFGGTKGITWFDPKNLDINEPFLGLVLSDLSVFNEKIRIGHNYQGNVILKEALQETKKITLNYRQNNLSISFNALDFTTPDWIKYAYRLKGLDHDWQIAKQGNRTAVYTNLPPGEYIFVVKAYTTPANEQTVQLVVLITPPWWLTWWAKVFYAMLAALLLYGIYRMIGIRMKEKQQMLEKEHNELLAQSKLQFFTNISHEIRTPLTLVISPLLKLIQEEKNTERLRIYQIMHRNSTRILRLVNQLLDIRKIDRGQMHLCVREVDAVSFINDIVDSLAPLSVDKNIVLSFISEQIPDTVWMDIDFMDKVIYNLLSNAFKFTEKGGNIEVRLQVTVDDMLEFQVKDNGKGISSEHISAIFERFYQINPHNAPGSVGTGIGLHLSKMLVELHHGSIRVVSIPGEGSTFTVSIPYTKTRYQTNEINEIPLEYTGSTSMESMAVLMDKDGNTTEGPGDAVRSRHKFVLLIVEDNEDIRSLLRRELENRFQVIEAVDGKSGYESAKMKMPDLIITDVMMPVMDGIEMTRRLRGNSNTRQIPIIMLTAKTTLDESLEGLGAGADIYIAKPFDLRYLLVHVINLLNRQTFARVCYTNDNHAVDSSFDVKSSDDKLLGKLHVVIQAHISDSSFSIEALSDEVGISRVHLHRKLKELCKLTPSIYLRNIRLEHAAHLLRTKKISIAEVAFAVGFGSHQYFTNCFKDFYGFSPADYADKYREEKDS